MLRAERLVMLNTMDQFWRRHLTDLDVLREGIGLMAIAQRDPLVEYQREAFAMWGDMQGQIRLRAAYDLLNIRVQTAQQQPVRRNIRAWRPGAENGAATDRPEPVRKTAKQKLGRKRTLPLWQWPKVQAVPHEARSPGAARAQPGQPGRLRRCCKSAKSRFISSAKVTTWSTRAGLSVWCHARSGRAT